MPPVLERCVAHLRDRGATESSAYAICTASLKRAGKMPMASSMAKKVDPSELFGVWANRVALPDVLRSGMAAVYDSVDGADLATIERLTAVRLVEMDGVLGMAKLHSKVIAMNPTALARLGNKPVWYGAVTIHEAMHAVYGFMEHEATRAEQRYAGNHFGVAKLAYDRGEMEDALRVAAIAQGQREIHVHRSHRRDDLAHLTGSGFTPRVGRKVLRMGVEIGKRMLENDTIRALTRRMGIVPVPATKQYICDLPESVEGWIAKVIDVEFERLMLTALGSDIVDKTLHDPSVYEPVEPSHAGPAQADLIERAVQVSVGRQIGQEFRGASGILPKLRRVGYDVTQLAGDDGVARDAALRELVADAAKSGLFTEDGRMTDTHVLLVMHGFTPAWARLEDALNAETEARRI